MHSRQISPIDPLHAYTVICDSNEGTITLSGSRPWRGHFTDGNRDVLNRHTERCTANPSASGRISSRNCDRCQRHRSRCNARQPCQTCLTHNESCIYSWSTSDSTIKRSAELAADFGLVGGDTQQLTVIPDFEAHGLEAAEFISSFALPNPRWKCQSTNLVSVRDQFRSTHIYHAEFANNRAGYGNFRTSLKDSRFHGYHQSFSFFAHCGRLNGLAQTFDPATAYYDDMNKDEHSGALSNRGFDRGFRGVPNSVDILTTSQCHLILQTLNRHISGVTQ